MTTTQAIKALQRRIVWLEDRASSRSNDFERAELSALLMAVKIMEESKLAAHEATVAAKKRGDI